MTGALAFVVFGQVIWLPGGILVCLMLNLSEAVSTRNVSVCASGVFVLFVNRLAIPNPPIQGSLIVCARLCLQKGSNPSPSFRQVGHQTN